MSPVVVTLVVLIGAVILFITNVVPAPVTAAIVALVLFFTGTLGFDDAVGGFGDSVLVYLAALFIVSEALDATGITTWAGQQVSRRVGGKPTKVITAVMLLCAVFTAFISVDGAVAALVPVAVMLATRIGAPPSKLLIPLVFAAHAASMLTLLGTPINVIVSDMAVESGSRGFGFFEFGIVGLPLVAGTFGIVLAFGPRLLPAHPTLNAPRDLTAYAQELAQEFRIDPAKTATSYESGVTEVVVAPRSTLVGASVFPGMVTDAGNLVVVAVSRAGRALERAALQVGDVILLRGTWDALNRRASHPGVVVVNQPDEVRRQSVNLGPRAYAALGVLLVMCVLLAVGVFPTVIVVLAAAAVLVGVRVITVEQAVRSVSLPTLVVVAGMIPLSTAIQTSGLADILSRWIVATFGGGSPRLLLFGIVITVAVLGQFANNLATVLIVAPIALSVADTQGLSPLPFLMGIAVAAAAAFLTPIANTANLMVQGPGGYRFGDYWKLGLPLLAFFVLVATLLVPVVWPF